MARPHPHTAITIARPCRCTRPSQPENTPPSSAPTAGAATSRPVVRASPPYQSSATAGYNARGYARTIAHMSEKKVIRRLGRPARNRRPSTTEARLRRSPSGPSGSIAGSRHIAYRAAEKATASIRYAVW